MTHLQTLFVPEQPGSHGLQRKEEQSLQIAQTCPDMARHCWSLLLGCLGSVLGLVDAHAMKCVTCCPWCDEPAADAPRRGSTPKLLDITSWWCSGRPPVWLEAPNKKKSKVRKCQESLIRNAAQFTVDSEVLGSCPSRWFFLWHSSTHNSTNMKQQWRQRLWMVQTSRDFILCW